MAITYHSGRRIQGLAPLSADTTGTQVTASNGVVSFDIITRTTNHAVTYDIGSNLSDSAWVMRAKLDYVAITGNSGSTVYLELGVGSASSSTAFANGGITQDFIGLQQRKASDADGWGLVGYNSTGSLNNPESPLMDSVPNTLTTYYVEIKRLTSTSMSIGLYTTSSYQNLISGIALETKTDVPSGVTGLRYIRVGNAGMISETAGNVIEGTVTDVEIWDGVTTASGDSTYQVHDPKPTNVQVGSRYEETDTRKMYHYTAPQAATDDIFSTGTGWSGDTSTYPYNSTINGIGCDTSTLGEAVTKTVTTLSASGQWVLRFKVTRETGDLGDGVMINLGSSSASTSSLARMQNGNGLYPYGIHLIYFANSNNVYAGGSHDGSFAWDFQSNANVTWSAGDTRWVEVSHASSTAYTTKVYSNANFTGTAVLTSVASPSSQTLNYDDITIGTKWSSNRKHIDFEDMQIWNGVTTAPASDNTWEEEGT